MKEKLDEQEDSYRRCDHALSHKILINTFCPVAQNALEMD